MLAKISALQSTRRVLKSKGLAARKNVRAKKTIGNSYDVDENKRLKKRHVGNTYDGVENTGIYTSHPTMLMKNKMVIENRASRLLCVARATFATCGGSAPCAPCGDKGRGSSRVFRSLFSLALPKTGEKPGLAPMPSPASQTLRCDGFERLLG